jgi:8-amino-7-oxononanoate synthase
MTGLDDLIAPYLTSLGHSGRYRRLRRFDHADPGLAMVDGRRMVSFCSNDYLGLRAHPLLVARAAAFAERWGTGAGASRLVSGNLAPFEEIEAKLARGKGTETALLFPSGFQANASILPALLDRDLHGRDMLVFSDRLNHASIHLGLKAAGIHPIRFRHNDLGHLSDLLRRHESDRAFRLIVTESIFSMDGDRADLAGLVELAQQWGAALYVDEAHATGLHGRDGFGLCCGLPVDLVMGTFSKALGSFGAYVACSAKMREYLINRCAGLIYATALPPPILGAIDAALDLLPELSKERKDVLTAAARMRNAWRDAGLDTGRSDTQIIPVILGDERKALEVAAILEEQGLLAIAIRPPTVPSGTSRLRVALSAAHDDDQVNRLIAAMIKAAA